MRICGSVMIDGGRNVPSPLADENRRPAAVERNRNHQVLNVSPLKSAMSMSWRRRSTCPLISVDRRLLDERRVTGAQEDAGDARALLASARSLMPSRLKSPIAIAAVDDPTVISRAGWNVPLPLPRITVIDFEMTQGAV